MARHLTTGREGEEFAARWLETNGYTILHTNWRRGRYELDIVCRKGDTIHFVEVKCRRKGSLTSPEDAATGLKFHNLRKAAAAYIAFYNFDYEIQFDLAAVEYDDEGYYIRYIPDAMVQRW